MTTAPPPPAVVLEQRDRREFSHSVGSMLSSLNGILCFHIKQGGDFHICAFIIFQGWEGDVSDNFHTLGWVSLILN